MNDEFITLTAALELAWTESQEAAASLNDLNFITAGLLADALSRDSLMRNDREDIREALMLLTPEQFSVILQALEHRRGGEIAAKALNDGHFPDNWNY